jgi:beta-lactamase class D
MALSASKSWPLALAATLAALPAHATCTALAEASTGKVLKQSGVCDRRLSPASTFKLPISLMGFDAGVLKDENTPALPFKKGYPDWIEAWKQTQTPASWLKVSCVWYSQEITRALGEERFARYVKQFGYGNADVSGNPGQHDGLTQAWLDSSLQISPLEQLAFLGKVVRRELGVSAHAYDLTSKLLLVETLPNGWRVHGKTGTGAPRNADNSRDWAHTIGWFVGWAVHEKSGRTVTFVRQIEDQGEHELAMGPRARAAMLKDLPALLDAP